MERACGTGARVLVMESHSPARTGDAAVCSLDGQGTSEDGGGRWPGRRFGNTRHGLCLQNLDFAARWGACPCARHCDGTLHSMLPDSPGM